MLSTQFPEVAAMGGRGQRGSAGLHPLPARPLAQGLVDNPLERLNAEIKRRTNVVGIFPDDASVLRLVTAVVVDTHDEWQVAERRYLSEDSMMANLQTTEHTGPVTIMEAPHAITA